MADINAALREKLGEKAIKAIAKFKPDMDALSTQRADLMDAYLRQPYGNEVTGRSEFITSDVFEVVQGPVSTLLDIFVGGPEVVNVKPRKYKGPDSITAAKLLEEKDNFDFMRLSDGYALMSDFVTDPLLGKVGFVKTTWVTEKKEIHKEYTQVSELDYRAVLADPSFTVDDVQETEISPESVDMQTGIPIPAVKEYTISGREIDEISYAKSVSVAPEDFTFDVYSTDINKTFCAHRKLMNKEEIASRYDIPVDEVNATVNKWLTNVEAVARWSDLGGISFISPDKESEDAYIHECYVTDYDKGVKKHYIVTLLAKEVLDVEVNKYGRPPFHVNSAIRQAHRGVGLSLAEFATDIQELHTALVRYIMDNIYFQNNKRYVLNPFAIDADAFLNDNVPGGVVFTLNGMSPEAGYKDITPQPLPGDSYKMLEYMQTMRENRTGQMGANPGPVPTQAMYTSSGINQMLNKINEKTKIIARNMAEGGIKDMFQFRIELNTQFFSGKQAIEVDGNWKVIDANKISGMFDVVVDVGVGTGSKELVVQQLRSILEMYAMIMKLSPDPKMLPFGPENIYNVFKEILVNMGYKNVEQYIGEPLVKTVKDAIDSTPPPQPSWKDTLSIDKLVAIHGFFTDDEIRQIKVIAGLQPPPPPEPQGGDINGQDAGMGGTIPSGAGGIPPLDLGDFQKMAGGMGAGNIY